MFSKIKNFVKNLFSARAEEKSPVPARQAKKKKHTTKAPAVPAAAPKNKNKKKKPPVQAANDKVKAEKKFTPPPRPETLADVPVCEGKVRFLDYALHENVQFGIQHAGFQYCTPIQEMTLPPLLDKRDLAGKAQTGTGKTAAFLRQPV